MMMKKEILLQGIEKSDNTFTQCPAWNCPTCGIAQLSIKEDTYSLHQTAASQKREEHIGCEVEHLDFIFNVLLKCANPACGEAVHVNGTGRVEEFKACYRDENTGEEIWIEYLEFLTPVYIDPPLQIFETPEVAPDEVAEAMKESFRYCLVDANVAAHKLRIAIEILLDKTGIKKTSLTKKEPRKRRYLILNERLKIFTEQNEYLGKLLMAVKLIGNSGSHHRDSVKFDDLYDSYLIVSQVLNELYSDTSFREIQKKARGIIKRKGR